MELDGPLSPSKGERVPKAGEGAVQGFKARTRSGNSLTEGEQCDRLHEYGSDLPAGVAANEHQRRSQALSRRGRRRLYLREPGSGAGFALAALRLGRVAANLSSFE